jgi:hypothetical protein
MASALYAWHTAEKRSGSNVLIGVAIYGGTFQGVRVYSTAAMRLARQFRASLIDQAHLPQGDDQL